MSALLDTAIKLPDRRAVGARDARAFMAAIERERVACGLSRAALTALAGISLRSYQRYAAGERLAGGAELRRLARALASREAQRPREEGLLRALAVRHLEGLAQLVDQRAARNLTIYLAHVELGMAQRDLARLFGVSSNRINHVVQKIELRRDDGSDLDRTLMELSSQLDRDAMAFGRAAA